MLLLLVELVCKVLVDGEAWSLRGLHPYALG